MKQRTLNVHGHKPFTDEYNKVGLIHPKKIIEKLKALNVNEVFIYLELSFREREPYDSNVIEVLKESVNYWKRFL
jgi:D-erythrulose 1-phosphate 3-epimerase